MDSAHSVEKALNDFEEDSEDFRFKGRLLRLDRHKHRQKSKATFLEQLLHNNPTHLVNFDITNVHYGTFIVGIAMKEITGDKDYGLIAHRLVNDEKNIRFRLQIDTQKREISILVYYESLYTLGSTVNLAFTWPFGT